MNSYSNWLKSDSCERFLLYLKFKNKRKIYERDMVKEINYIESKTEDARKKGDYRIINDTCSLFIVKKEKKDILFFTDIRKLNWIMNNDNLVFGENKSQELIFSRLLFKLIRTHNSKPDPTLEKVILSLIKQENIFFQICELEKVTLNENDKTEIDSVIRELDDLLTVTTKDNFVM